MPSATLLDRCLSSTCHEHLRQVLWPIIDRFLAYFPLSLEFWRNGGYQRLVLEFQIHNFGVIGGQYLYSKLGIVCPDESFLARARLHIPRIGRMLAETCDANGATFLRPRVFTYAEYHF